MRLTFHNVFRVMLLWMDYKHSISIYRNSDIMFVLRYIENCYGLGFGGVVCDSAGGGEDSPFSLSFRFLITSSASCLPTSP